MLNHNIQFYYKDKTALKKYFRFIKKHETSVSIKWLKQKGSRKIITLLKSPHVNKSAQEQFKIMNLKTKTNRLTIKKLNQLLIFKLLKNFGSSTLRFNIKINTAAQIKKKLTSKCIKLNNFKLNLFETKKKSDTKNDFKMISSFKILDAYGELF